MWGERFEQFAARKTHEALSASLPPYATELEAPDSTFVRIGNVWTMAQFGGPFYLSPVPSHRPGCNLVFVRSTDGNTGARNPHTLGGGATDAHVIYEGLSRVAADAVLSGAETVRDAQMILSVWHPQLVALRETLGKVRHPTQVVATLRGLDLESRLMFNVPAVPVALLTSRAAAESMGDALAARPWIVPIAMQTPLDLPLAFERLRELGIERVSAIGGRNLAAQLIDAGLVDDLYLTTSPKTAGQPHTPFYPGEWDAQLVVRKRGTGPEEGVVFEHWRDPKPRT